jgi:hypothetical protein
VLACCTLSTCTAGACRLGARVPTRCSVRQILVSSDSSHSAAMTALVPLFRFQPRHVCIACNSAGLSQTCRTDRLRTGLLVNSLNLRATSIIGTGRVSPIVWFVPIVPPFVADSCRACRRSQAITRCQLKTLTVHTEHAQCWTVESRIE